MGDRNSTLKPLSSLCDELTQGAQAYAEQQYIALTVYLLAAIHDCDFEPVPQLNPPHLVPQSSPLSQTWPQMMTSINVRGVSR